MAAHSPLTTIVPPVAPDQPQTAWPQWLRDIAQAINLVGSRINNPAPEIADTVTLTGDVAGSGAGTVPATVQGLQGWPLSPTAPGSSQVLQWSGATWAPATIPLGSGSGDIDSVAAGTGLTGGGTAGDVTLALVTPVAVAHGGTGAATADGARANLGAAPLIEPITPVTGTTTLPPGTTGWVFVSAAAPLTVTLPATPATGHVIVVKDVVGSSETYPITINGGGPLIDGAATLVLSVNYGWARLVYTGTQWAQV